MSKKKRSVWNKTQQFQFISIQTGFGEIRNYQTQNSKCPSMYFHRPSALHQHKQSVFHSADTRQSPNKRNRNDRKSYRGTKTMFGSLLQTTSFHLHSSKTVHRSFKWFKVSSVPLTNSGGSRTSGLSICTSTASSFNNNKWFVCVCVYVHFIEKTLKTEKHTW